MNRYSDDDALCDIRLTDSEAVRRALVSVPDARERKAVVDILDAIADDTRLRILCALFDEELCVCDIAAICGVSQSGVSHQLRLMRDRNLVAFRRDGKRAVYRLADSHVRTIVATALEHARELRA